MNDNLWRMVDYRDRDEHIKAKRRMAEKAEKRKKLLEQEEKQKKKDKLKARKPFKKVKTDELRDWVHNTAEKAKK